MDNFQKLPRIHVNEAHLWSDGYYRTEPEPESNKKDGYIYSPPAWRVCSNCDGSGVETDMPTQGDYFPQDEKCLHCNGTGRIPIRYTPEQWRDAGGVLSDDTPVWVFFTDDEWGVELYGNMSPHIPNGRIVIATEAGAPPEDCRLE